MLLLALVLITTSASAQEAIRMSLASSEAAEARRKAATTVGYHNLRLGPTAWNFAAGLGVEFNDNVYYRPSGQRADLILRPQFDTRMLWPVSDQNSITLSLGAGYSAYLDNSELSRMFISPNTELSFDLYVGNFWINLHDRITIIEDNYSDPTVVGNVDYSRMENTIGATATWDLNKVIVRLGYDHANYTSLSSGDAAYPDGQAEMIFLTAGYAVNRNMMAGLELGGSLISYDLEGTNVFFSDALQWNAGAFLESKFSDYLRGRLSAGFTMFSPDTSDPAIEDESGTYVQLGLTHRVNKHVDYTLGFSRRVSFTFYGGTIDMYTVNLYANWRLIQKVALSTGFTYEHGEYLYGFSEEFDRYGPSIQLSRKLSNKLSATLAYRLYLRDSNIALRDYTLNIVSLNLRYQF